jgi:hypothetical protein
VTDASWRVDDPDLEEVVAPGSMPLLVSLHFLRSALRRRWRVWVGFAVVGLVLGIVLNVEIPAKSTGTVTLLLAHDPSQDPTLAMATDVSLLSTRTLASTVTGQLGLNESSEQFLESFTAQAVTNDVLVLRVSAPDDAGAVTRARTLGDDYLTFRANQMRTQSQALVDGYNKQISALQDQVNILTTRYNALSTQGPSGQAQAAAVLTQRSQISQEISTLQQTVEDSTLQTSAVVDASHVLDPASAVRKSAKKRAVLDVGSGLIGGTAIGIGLVLFLAITSNRLRRRDEVATALTTSVRYSVGPLELRRRPWSRLTRKGRRRARDLEVLVRGLDSSVRHHPGRRTRLVLASIDGSAAAAVALAGLTARFTSRGLAVFLVDLSEAGRLDRIVTTTLARADASESPPAPSGPTSVPVVYRPSGVPTLSRGPLGAEVGLAGDLAHDDVRRPAWDAADVILTLAEVDPAVGAEHLTTWGEQVILVVTAGRSSAERLRTTGELIRSAGLRLLFAVMVGADRSDESLGEPDAVDGAAPTRRSTTR